MNGGESGKVLDEYTYFREEKVKYINKGDSDDNSRWTGTDQNGILKAIGCNITSDGEELYSKVMKPKQI